MSVCLSVIISLCSGLFLCTVMQYIGFMGVFFFCLIGRFSMIVWTPTVFECLICMRFLFSYCTCSAQLSMFHMDKRSRNTLIIIIIIIINLFASFSCSRFH